MPYVTLCRVNACWAQPVADRDEVDAKFAAGSVSYQSSIVRCPFDSADVLPSGISIGCVEAVVVLDDPPVAFDRRITMLRPWSPS